MRARLLPLLLALAACDSAGPPQVREARPVYDYVLKVPPHYVRQNVFGEDSKVERWKAPGVTLTTDFGRYTGHLDCAPGQRNCSEHREAIAGRPAEVTRTVVMPRTLGEGRTFTVHVYIPVLVRDGRVETALGMDATCTSKPLCDQALQVMRGVEIVPMPRV